MKNRQRGVAWGVMAGLVIGMTAWGQGVGYDDTPFLPGGKWRVHDKARPNPKIVQPGTFSTQQTAGQPPADAIVLFDGTDLSQWKGTEKIMKDGKAVGSRECEARWKVKDDYVEVAPKTGYIRTKAGFGSCQLHVEWMAPPPVGNSQSRGNSGVFFMERYEVQVLDCYDNVTYADGQAASVYGQKPPDVNVCRKPGEWQVYDIVFEAPVFKDNKLVKPAYLTIFHNGVLVQNHVELLGATSHKRVAKYSAHPDKLPISLQDHGNPTRFRNIWLRPLATGN